MSSPQGALQIFTKRSRLQHNSVASGQPIHPFERTLLVVFEREPNTGAFPLETPWLFNMMAFQAPRREHPPLAPGAPDDVDLA